MSDIKYLISVDASGAVTSIKNFEDALNGAGNQADKSTPKFTQMFGAVALGQAAFDLTKKAGSGFMDFVKDSVQGAIDEERAERSLVSALEITGRTVDGNRQHYLEFAMAQHQATLYTHEQVEAAQTLLLQLTKLDQDGVDRATKGAMGLATVMGTDLQSAAMMVTKAMEGNYQALQRVGIKIDENLSPHEKQAALLDQLEKLYRRSTDEVNTFGGRLEQAKKNVDEMKESLGKVVITGIEPFVKLVGKAAQAVMDLITANETLAEKSKTDAERTVEFGNRLHDAAMKAGMTSAAYGTLAFKCREYSGAVQDQIDQWRAGGNADAVILEMLDKQGSAYTVNTVKLAGLVKQTEYGAKVHEILANTARPIPPIIDQIGNSAAKADPGFGKLYQDFFKLNHEVSDFGTKMPTIEKDVELSEKSVDEWGDSIVALGKDYQGVDPIILGVLNDIQDASDRAKKAAEDSAAAEKTLSQARLQGFLDDLGAASSFFGDLGALSQATAASEQADLDAWYNKQKEIIGATITDETEKQKQLEELDKKYTEAKKKGQHDAAVSQKGAAYASAVINTAEAITKALTGGVPPFNMILAAISAAAGAVQIATIAAQPIPSFDVGGAVKKTGPAFLHAGEVVLNPDQVQALRGGRSVGSGRQVYQIHNHIHLGGKRVKDQIIEIVQEASNNKTLRIKSSTVN